MKFTDEIAQKLQALNKHLLAKHDTEGLLLLNHVMSAMLEESLGRLKPLPAITEHDSDSL